VCDIVLSTYEDKRLMIPLRKESAERRSSTEERHASGKVSGES